MRFRLPPERIGRPPILAAGLLALAWLLPGCRGCDVEVGPSDAPSVQMHACRDACAPLPVASWTAHVRTADGHDLGSACICAKAPDGGRQ